MKPAGIIGLILIVAGILAVAYGGYTSFTTQENVVKLGPLEINREDERRVPVVPIVGGVAVVGGIILLVTGTKKS